MGALTAKQHEYFDAIIPAPNPHGQTGAQYFDASIIHTMHEHRQAAIAYVATHPDDPTGRQQLELYSTVGGPIRVEEIDAYLAHIHPVQKGV